MPTTSIVSSAAGTIVDVDGDSRLIDVPLDEVFVSDDPAAYVASVWADGSRLAANELTPLPPIGTQEVWAAGVTYEVSRTARMEESEAAADVYERVYDAARPELFFKANARSVVGAGAAIRVRADSSWNVPEPELALAVSRSGAYLLTGAGLVPEAPFTLLPGDVVSITIDGIGTLTNPVARPR